MQQRQKQSRKQKTQRMFSASEVGAYEHCSRSWWYEHYEPLAQAGDEELFAYLVTLEHEHGPQAPILPDYQVTEQLLVRRGAFEARRQQDNGDAAKVTAMNEDEEYSDLPAINEKIRIFTAITLCLAILATLFILVAFLLPPH